MQFNEKSLSGKFLEELNQKHKFYITKRAKGQYFTQFNPFNNDGSL